MSSYACRICACLSIGKSLIGRLRPTRKPTSTAASGGARRSANAGAALITDYPAAQAALGAWAGPVSRLGALASAHLAVVDPVILGALVYPYPCACRP